MGQDTKDMPDIFRAEILDNRFRKLCFSHREKPP
jgi:hypothetical protein